MSVSRRAFLGGAGAAGAGLVAASCSSSRKSPAAADDVVAFHGANQAGIATPPQDRLAFAAFDVMPGTTRAELATLLRTWTDAAARMTAGLPVVPDDAARPEAPPQDTGEAAGLPAAHLTITIGFGPSLFDDRFGLAHKLPAALARIPALPGDDLDPAISDGDICVQACADDPQVAFHAVRNLRRLAFGTAALRWFQLGFSKTSSTLTGTATPRNLLGFKDGTNNITSDDHAGLAAHVWVGAETDQAWMKGGSYAVTRRIAMRLEAWDRDNLADQENVIGRHKISGAPLGAAAEHDAVPLTAKNADGTAVVPMDAHIRLAAPSENAGLRILRRGYSFTDGTDPDTGELDAGLFFIAYQQDPRKQFVALQRKLGAHDALNEYIQHRSSAVFAVPPGTQPGGFVGEGLFA
ncbi:MAG TPA: iron uptake transporter deferrochelatase/peroxidase subunit [Mycobacteriales bacterium]|nr:iron uptake transporter deferrochelatase/peroxidase subunit [Mycobacteriales bacterium]